MNSRPVDSLVLVRALAILLVVANHAFPERLHGGMNMLMVVSGVAMARLAFAGTTADTIRSFFRFTKHLVIPSLVMFFPSALYRQRLPVAEMLQFSNWLTPDRISLFPIWYTQCMLQLLIVLGVLFHFTDMTAKIRRHPVATTSILFLAAVSAAALGLIFQDPDSRVHGLPHLLGWHFVFGWLIWALSQSELSPLTRKGLLTAIHLASSLLLFLILEGERGEERFAAMVIPMAILIWIDRVRLPGSVAHAVNLISLATFAIFLLHYSFFLVAQDLVTAFNSKWLLRIEPWILLSAGIAGPVIAWALWHATIRVWRRYRLAERRNSAAVPMHV